MVVGCVVFVFKQKTAYEMRISDWSSDVCSSDLAIARPVDSGIVELVETRVGIGIGGREVEAIEEPRGQLRLISLDRGLAGVVGDDRTVGLRLTGLQEIGSASCRDRVCQSV